MLSDTVWSALSTTPLLGTRVYPIKLPHAPAYPVAVYENRSQSSEATMAGTTGQRSASLRVTVMSRSYVEASAAIEQLEDALLGIQGGGSDIYTQGVLVVDRRDGSVQETDDPDSILYAPSITVDIHHNKT